MSTDFDLCTRRPALRPDGITVADLPGEDIVVLASDTCWQLPWELMMLGPFLSCGLVDTTVIRHLTVPSMVASAVRRRSTPDARLVAEDYPALPVFAADMPLLDAAVLVAETGWDLAVVMLAEPRVITARNVYRALGRAGVASTLASRSIGAAAVASVAVSSAG